MKNESLLEKFVKELKRWESIDKDKILDGLVYWWYNGLDFMVMTNEDKPNKLPYSGEWQLIARTNKRTILLTNKGV